MFKGLSLKGQPREPEARVPGRPALTQARLAALERRAGSVKFV